MDDPSVRELIEDALDGDHPRNRSERSLLMLALKLAPASFLREERMRATYLLHRNGHGRVDAFLEKNFPAEWAAAIKRTAR